MSTTTDLSLDRQLSEFNQWKTQLMGTMDDYQRWLERYQLLTPERRERIRECRLTLQRDRLTLAFVAEFSRGKTELINAIFFSDYGRRLLPSTAGRTTMCPTELFYDDAADSAYISLLPMETRTQEVTLEQLKADPKAWVTHQLDLASADRIEDRLREIIETRQVPVEAAAELGLYKPDPNQPEAEAPIRVDIPKWRHARVSFPHPLLKQGLTILDTPGLNALGSEPELTLSMLPAAQAILFVLAADTGVTRTDLEMWQNHIKGFDPRRQHGLIVVLNKIDTLWDELQSAVAVEAMIAKQKEETSRILGISTCQIFPVSAQKGLLAKVKTDTALLERSALSGLELHLSRDILDARRAIIQDTVSAEFSQMLEGTLDMVAARQQGLKEQLRSLEGLAGKSEHVIEHMISATRDEHLAYLEDVKAFRENREALRQQSESLYRILDLSRIDQLIDETRGRMLKSRTTLGLRSNMRLILSTFRTDMQILMHESEEVRKKARSVYRLFQTLHGFTVTQPRMFSVMRYRVELETLLKEAEVFRNGLHIAITEKHFLIKQFFSAVVSRARAILSAAKREIDSWMKMVLEPLAFQIRERRNLMESKIQDMQKISQSRENLQRRIADLTEQETAISTQQAVLRDMHQALHRSHRTTGNNSSRPARQSTPVTA